MVEQLRKKTLQHQGLTTIHPFGKGKKAVLSALEHLGYIQIDTLSVVERAHHHTLWTRIPDYQNDYLNQLVKERKVFEYWFHAASYLPMKDFRYVLPQMSQFKRGEISYYNNIDTKTLRYVIDKIRIEGPLKTRDFQSSNKKAGSWWNWKPTKVALEKLFMQGDIMVCRREGMQKVYDLTERVLPDTVNTTEPTPSEFAEYLVNTHLRAYGCTTVKQITHLRTRKSLRKDVEQILQTMTEAGTIEQIQIDGMPTVYVNSNLLETTIKKPTANVWLLSPFDNSTIHRDRVKQLFNFDFRLECYTPKRKRQYGYFCLPILFGDQFIGRIDCKAHRKTREFEIISLHIEKKENANLWLEPLTKAIKNFSHFNNCQSIKLTQVSPPKWSDPLKNSLQNNLDR